MTEDGRNSINLWVGALAVAAIVWAAMHFDLLNRLPEPVVWLLIGLGVATTAIQIVRGAWRLRAGGKQKPVKKPE